MPELIIHADDYGLTTSVSEGILEAHAHGVVTSTSILMTHVTPRELVWLKADPTLDLGLHLNLTSGSPVSLLSEVPHLLQLRRVFTIPRVEDPTSPHKRFDFSAIPPNELARELTAQVAAGRDSGLPLSHLDTHHHIHRDPRIFGMVLQLAHQEGLALRTLNDAQRKACREAGVPTIDVFLGDWFGAGGISRESLLESVSTVGEDQQAELMCHPGKVSETLEALSSYGEERAVELALLQEESLRGALRNLGVRLIGWRDV